MLKSAFNVSIGLKIEYPIAETPGIKPNRPVVFLMKVYIKKI